MTTEVHYIPNFFLYKLGMHIIHQCHIIKGYCIKYEKIKISLEWGCKIRVIPYSWNNSKNWRRETSHKKSREGFINTSKVITLLSLHLEIQDNK